MLYLIRIEPPDCIVPLWSASKNGLLLSVEESQAWPYEESEADVAKRTLRSRGWSKIKICPREHEEAPV
jgi:hypothetical protein